jgi:hypothetical protein
MAFGPGIPIWRSVAGSNASDRFPTRKVLFLLAFFDARDYFFVSLSAFRVS